jgi:DNA repair exonuclease SbcCD ATPase subunit
MSEETKEESISEETMAELNKEIEKVEETKLVSAKEEGKKEALSEIDKIKQELSELRQKNDAAEKARNDEAEKQKLLEELRREREKLEQPVKKHLVAETPNPTANAPTPATPEPVQKLTPEQEWREFEKRFDGVSVTVKR